MIILHAAGGPQIGIGNISRVSSLASELLTLGVKNIFVLLEADENLVKDFKIMGVEYVFAHDRIEALKFRKELLVRFMHEQRKILITDLLNLNKSDSDFARAQGFDYIIHLTHSGMNEYQPDLFVDGEVFKEDWKLNKSITLLKGAEYQIIRPEIRKYRPSSSWHGNKVKNFLLCFGGADPAHFSEAFIEYLAKYNFFDEFNEDITFTLVIGPAVSEKRWNNMQKIKTPRLKMQKAPSDIGQIILKHDLLITLGGIMVYEALCLGKPVFAIEWDYLAYFVEKLDNAGVIKKIKNGERSFDDIFKYSHRTDFLAQIANKGWRLADGFGAMRVANYIYSNILCSTNKT